MALADWFSMKSPLALEGESVRLRPPRSSDFDEWSMLRRVSRDFRAPPGKRISVPVRIEPKVYFAAERTFLVRSISSSPAVTLIDVLRRNG